MDKIKLPIEWHDLAEEFLDADGQIITIDRITEALNAAADKDRQIAVLSRVGRSLLGVIETYDEIANFDFLDKDQLFEVSNIVHSAEQVLDAALAESKRIQEGE